MLKIPATHYQVTNEPAQPHQQQSIIAGGVGRVRFTFISIKLGWLA
jgi:hypothetical protein